MELKRSMQRNSVSNEVSLARTRDSFRSEERCSSTSREPGSDESNDASTHVIAAADGCVRPIRAGNVGKWRFLRPDGFQTDPAFADDYGYSGNAVNLNRRKKKTYSKLCRQLLQTRRHAKSGQELDYPDDGDAYKPVLFQVALGALHLDILEGRKPRADPITRRGASFGVLT